MHYVHRIVISVIVGLDISFIGSFPLFFVLHHFMSSSSLHQTWAESYFSTVWKCTVSTFDLNAEVVFGSNCFLDLAQIASPYSLLILFLSLHSPFRFVYSVLHLQIAGDLLLLRTLPKHLWPLMALCKQTEWKICFWSIFSLAYLC